MLRARELRQMIQSRVTCNKLSVFVVSVLELRVAWALYCQQHWQWQWWRQVKHSTAILSVTKVANRSDQPPSWKLGEPLAGQIPPRLMRALSMIFHSLAPITQLWEKCLPKYAFQPIRGHHNVFALCWHVLARVVGLTNVICSKRCTVWHKRTC
jgi:hypothetical protein